MSYRKNEYKDLAKWANTRNKGKKKYYQATQGYPKRRWTKEENEIILERRLSDRQLSLQLERSIQSIQMQRYRLKKTSIL